jgi:hypothetical protein
MGVGISNPRMTIILSAKLCGIEAEELVRTGDSDT